MPRLPAPEAGIVVKYVVKTPVGAPASTDARHSRRPETTKWFQIGHAWRDDEGDGRITVVLDAIPFRSEYLYLFPEEPPTRSKP